MKKQSIALTVLALLASSASYGCEYNFYFGGCGEHEQRKGKPIAQCSNTDPAPVGTDSTQQHVLLGQVAVELLNAFFSKLNVTANPEAGEGSFRGGDSIISDRPDYYNTNRSSNRSRKNKCSNSSTSSTRRMGQEKANSRQYNRCHCH